MNLWWKRYIPFISMFAGIVISLVPFNLAAVCTKLLELKSGAFVHMVCHWTGTVEVILGILIAVISAAAIVFADSGKVSGIALIALGVTGFLIPLDSVIGICKNPMMACHTTVQVLYPFLGITVATGIALLLLSRKNPYKNQKE